MRPKKIPGVDSSFGRMFSHQPSSSWVDRTRYSEVAFIAVAGLRRICTTDKDPGTFKCGLLIPRHNSSACRSGTSAGYILGAFNLHTIGLSGITLHFRLLSHHKLPLYSASRCTLVWRETTHGPHVSGYTRADWGNAMYCTSIMIQTTDGVLRKNPAPTDVTPDFSS